MGMFETLVGSRVPQKYRKYFDLPERKDSYSLSPIRESSLGKVTSSWLAGKGQIGRAHV